MCIRDRYNTDINFDFDHTQRAGQLRRTYRTKSFSASTQKQSHLLPLHTKTKSIEPYTKNKLFRPAHKTNDTHTKINQISIRTLQPSHFRCTHKNKVIFHRPRKHQVNSDPRTKPKSPTQNTKKMSTSRLKSSPFRSPLWNEVNFHVPTQKRTKFDHPHKKHINSDAYTEIKSMSIPTLTHWRRVNFDLPHKTPVSRSPH